MDKSEKEPLVSYIPERGTIEWAHYVQDHYSTDYFKPADLFCAGMMIERERLRNKKDCKDID